MAKSAKVIKKRIGSVKNSKKITKSMQMIAAAKMQKTVRLAMQSKKYTELGTEVLMELSKVKGIEHGLLEEKELKNELLIIISSNRGLCGNFNVGVLNKAAEFVKEWKQNPENKDANLKILAVGRKAASFAKRNEIDLIGFYEKLTDNPSFAAILPIAETAVKGFMNDEFDKVSIIFTKYISSLSQKVHLRAILPMNKTLLENQGINVSGEQYVEEEELNGSDNYKFEPGISTVLDYILPHMIETQLYQYVLESAASEHSNRMVAMKNSTDAASDIIDALTLEYNKSRQSAITQEVAEIIGGIETLTD